MSPARSDAHHEGGSPTKKALILEVAEGLGKPRYTPAEIEQIRRQLIAQLGAHGKTSPDYIVSVLEEAGLRVVWSTRSDTDGRYEEEFTDLLHFSTLEEAEMCLVRLDELLRKFLLEHEQAAAERVREDHGMARLVQPSFAHALRRRIRRFSSVCWGRGSNGGFRFNTRCSLVRTDWRRR